MKLFRLFVSGLRAENAFSEGFQASNRMQLERIMDMDADVNDT